MSVTTLHPLWKHAVETIRKKAEAAPEAFFDDDTLSGMIGEKLESKEHAFALMALRDELLRHNLVLLRVRCKNEPGYKLATDREKITIESERLFRRARNALIRELTTLHSVDVEQITEDDKVRLFDRRRRCGLRVLATTPRLARQLMKHVEMDNRTPRKWIEQLDTREYGDG